MYSACTLDSPIGYICQKQVATMGGAGYFAGDLVQTLKIQNNTYNRIIILVTATLH